MHVVSQTKHKSFRRWGFLEKRFTRCLKRTIKISPQNLVCADLFYFQDCMVNQPNQSYPNSATTSCTNATHIPFSPNLDMRSLRGTVIPVGMDRFGIITGKIARYSLHATFRNRATRFSFLEPRVCFTTFDPVEIWEPSPRVCFKEGKGVGILEKKIKNKSKSAYFRSKTLTERHVVHRSEPQPSEFQPRTPDVTYHPQTSPSTRRPKLSSKVVSSSFLVTFVAPNFQQGQRELEFR